LSYLYYFDKSRMGDDESVQGVPRESLSQEAFDNLPAFLQATVDKHPAYRKRAAKETEAEVEAPAGPVVEDDNGRS
jgi:hypothetical protein